MAATTMDERRHYEKWGRVVRIQHDVTRKALEAHTCLISINDIQRACQCRERGQIGRHHSCKGRKRKAGAGSNFVGVKKSKPALPHVPTAVVAEFLSSLNLRRDQMKQEQAPSEAGLKNVCQEVLDFHKKKEEEHLEKLSAIQREKIECLRRSDIEGYMKLASEIKSTRIQEILQRTQGCLRKLQDNMESLVESWGNTSKENSLQNSKHVSAPSDLEVVQPSLLSGGMLHLYQLEGLRWLASLHERGLNGILADEMGLGKTVQVIALISHLVESRKNEGPYLIAAPASVLPNWMREMSFWAPGLRAVCYSGHPLAREEMFQLQLRPLAKFLKSRKKAANHSGEPLPQVVATTYEMLMSKKDRGRLSSIPWQYIILDEGHRIKNANCRLNAELKNYTASHRLLLSGTPIQNNLDELWSLLNFLLPTVFDCSDDFNSWFSLPLAAKPKAGSSVKAHRSEEEAFLLSEEEKLLVVNRLHQMLRPLMLRRVKASVLGQLPAKRECLIKCMPSAYQQILHWYVAYLGCQDSKGEPASAEEKRTRKKSGDLHEVAKILFHGPKQRRLSVSNAVMEMRVICNHPFLSKVHPLDLEHALIDSYTRQLSTSAETDLQDEHEKSAKATLACLLRTCGKLEVLHRLLTKLWIGGHRVLLFCTMTKVLDVIEEYLDARAAHFTKDEEHNPEAPSATQQGQSTAQSNRTPLSSPSTNRETPVSPAGRGKANTSQPRSLPGDWGYCRLDGTTSKEERDRMIAEFNAPGSDAFIFLLSIRAGGQGINLQSADTVIMYDTDWNPQVDLQAQARAHRMGQKKDVLVIRLETAGTVEQQVRDAAEKKLGLANQSVTAGFFDGKTSDRERRQYLEQLIHQQKSSDSELSQSQHIHPKDADLTGIIARGDEERSLFGALDLHHGKESSDFELLADEELQAAMSRVVAETRES